LRIHRALLRICMALLRVFRALLRVLPCNTVGVLPPNTFLRQYPQKSYSHMSPERTLQHTLQHTLQRTLQHTATHTATHAATHAATHTAAHIATHTATHAATDTATHTATHCNTHCNTPCNTHCNTNFPPNTAAIASQYYFVLSPSSLRTDRVLLPVCRALFKNVRALSRRNRARLQGYRAFLRLPISFCLAVLISAETKMREAT